jgi:hypothetical protein
MLRVDEFVLSIGDVGDDVGLRLIKYDAPEPSAVNSPLTVRFIFELLPVPFVEHSENSPLGINNFFPVGITTLNWVLLDALYNPNPGNLTTIESVDIVIVDVSEDVFFLRRPIL